MHAAATRRLAGPEHRRTARLLGDNGVDDPEAWLVQAREQVLATLREHGPMTARSLGEAVPALRQPIVMAPGKSYSATVSAHTRVLLGLGFEGQIVRTRPTGSWINGAYTYASMDTWLDGGLGDLDEREAARDLALRWLRAFGPGTAGDLQWWAGWTAATTRTALADCSAVEVTLDEGTGYVAPGDEEPVEPVGPWVAMLPGLDPTTMGWKERGFHLGDHVDKVFDGNGNGGPTAWVDGRIVGVWCQRADGTVDVVLAERLGASARRALDAKAAELTAWLDGDVVRSIYLSPLAREHLAALG
jgi:hypothetical protein